MGDTPRTFEPEPEGPQWSPPPVQPGPAAQMAPAAQAAPAPNPAASDEPEPRSKRKLLLGIGAGVLAAALVAANAVLYVAIGDSERRAEDAIAAATAAGEELAGLQTEAAEYQAAIELFQQQQTNASDLMVALGTETDVEKASSDEWRDVAEGLAACQQARKKVVDALHGRGGSTSTSDADRKCNAALAAYKDLKGAS